MTEIIVNGGFETGSLDPWKVWVPTGVKARVIHPADVEPVEGSYVCEQTCLMEVSGGYEARGIYQKAPCNSNKFVFKYDVCTPKKISGNAKLKVMLMFYDAAGEAITWKEWTHSLSVLNEREWFVWRHEITLDTFARSVRVSFGFTETKGSVPLRIYLDNISLKEKREMAFSDFVLLGGLGLGGYYLYKKYFKSTTPP